MYFLGGTVVSLLATEVLVSLVVLVSLTICLGGTASVREIGSWVELSFRDSTTADDNQSVTRIHRYFENTYVYCCLLSVPLRLRPIAKRQSLSQTFSSDFESVFESEMKVKVN